MKTRLTNVVLFLFMSVGIAQAQESTVSSNAIYAEKIYLQTDAPLYVADERLWFTSTVIGADRKPSENSGVLHVDLIDVRGKILRSRKLKLDKGRAHGFFDLNDYNPGPYRLRAYTHWNRNFGPGFYATRPFKIQGDDSELPSLEPITDIYLTELPSGELSLSGRISDYIADSLTTERLSVEIETATSKNTLTVFPGPRGYVFNDRLPAGEPMATLMFTAADKTRYEVPIVLNADHVYLNFYPEGGELVNGIRSRVGFRATDVMGRPIAVQGLVANKDGDELVNFQSNEEGMGSFFLTPDGSQLTARLTSNKQDDTTYELPGVTDNGNVLHVEQRKDGFWVSVEGRGTNDTFSVELSSKGQKYFELAGKLTDGRFATRLDPTRLPEGVIELKLLDTNKNRLASRLVFNQNQNDRLRVNLSTSKASAKQRDRTDLQVNVTDAGGNAVRATGNLYVINKEQLGAYYQKEEGFVSRLLLTADLRSTLYNPGAYFENGQARYEKIDHLLLTTPPDDYLYAIEIGEITKMPEKGISVSGKVTGKLSKKRGKAGVDLVMMTFGNESNVFEQKTDEQGHFNFVLDDEYGEYIKLLFQSNRHGEKANLNVVLDNYEAPEVGVDVSQLMTQPDTIITRLAKKNQERKQIRDAFNFQNQVTDLGEFVVEEYRMTPVRQKMRRRFGEPVRIVSHDELMAARQEWSNGLYSILRYNIEEIIISNSVCLGARLDFASVRGCDGTIIMVDGQVVQNHDYQFLPYMNPEDIMSVEILRNPPRFNQAYFEKEPLAYITPQIGAIIAIYTISGQGIWRSMKKSGLKEQQVSVLSAPGLYEGPVYTQLTRQDWVIPDYRAMIHWEPVIDTDVEGFFNTSFYNADVPGDMLVVVELVSEDGRVGYAELDYKVTNKRRPVNAKADDE